MAEQNAAIRILQSKGQASNNINISKIEELIAASKMGVAGAPPPVVATPHENVLSIPIANSSPHKKQFSTPRLENILATPPQYHSLNLSKKMGHAHRSLTPSAEMFLRGGITPQQQEQILRSVTPSAGGGALTTPSDFIRANELLRATPTSVELHRLSAPADILRGTPTSADFLRANPTSMELMRATPTSAEFMRATPTSAELMRSSPSRGPGHHGGHGHGLGHGAGGGGHIDASSAEILRANPELLKSIPSSVADMLRASAAAGAPPAQSVMSSEPPRRREPSGTSEAFQHPGPT